MNKIEAIPNQSTRLSHLIKRSGSSYIPLVVALTQLPFLPGAIIGAVIIQFNAGLTTDQFIRTGVATFLVILLGFAIVIAFTSGTTSKANYRLGIWAKTGILGNDTDDERIAWKQITTLPWRLGVFLLGIVLFLEIGSVSLYQYFILKLSNDQVIYSFLGALIPGVAVVILAILVLERLLVPAREILLPKRFENQLVGSTNSYIAAKFIFIGMALIVITGLLLAPIGYHQTFKAIYETIGSIQLFNELRIQLLAASLFAIIVGLGLSLLVSRSLTVPIDSLIQTFIKVEEGNLSERARVLATDEIGELAIYFNRMISRLDELQQTLENRVAERTEQLRVSSEVGRIATTILDPDTVMTHVVELITESFDYYYASIFLVDENERWAELKAATGSAGEILKERHHQLQINKTSMVGTAISTREPQVALDVGDSAVRFNNPLLPNTRSEIAIPLMVGVRVIGAMDVQSIRGGDFQPEIISTLQSMANQVAIAIENARLFKEMDLALDELRQANREYVISAWSDKLKSNTFEYSTGSVQGLSDGEVKEIEVKLNLRDENIGHIRMETEGEWSKEDQAWVEALATQVAVSLENARLVDESQQAAFRERLSASIVQKLWSTNTIEGILQTTVREIGRALEASEATIKLEVED
jgi:GAF domain-containing protein/HAMP domain-containing protein